MNKITERDWIEALRAEQESAAKFDKPPSDRWKTGPEIAALLGVGPGHVHRYIPKTWRMAKFRRYTRAGIRPVLHYELPASIGAAAGGQPKLDSAAPALPAGRVKRAALARPVPARPARRKT